jgi:predicted nucleic acid-binding protein
VKLLDVNLLIYTVDEESSHHERTLRWFEETLSGSETVAFTWNALVGFLRITTRPRGARDPWPVHAALDRDLLVPLGTGGNLTSDAHLAALAIEHGATLCSHDNDFSRFAGLSWHDPLAG